MKLIKSFAMILAIVALGLCASAQAVSLTIGSGNYYVSVGDHDYLPYTYGAGGYQPMAMNFQSTMADYGQWVSMQPFGNVWQPYVAQGWRPYTEGHWAYTQYGPTWVGYEPWAWAGYHYGNWVFSQQFGWVWVPGYQYTPGAVAWAQGYNSMGWMPMPPAGYDYSRGYLAYVGPQNQFTIGNSDFSVGIGYGGGNDYYYGGPYYDPRYRNYYYNSNYMNMAGQLWTFIDPNYFTSDNYANYYFGGDYAQQLFNQHVVRISSQPLDRVVIERIVRQPIQVRQVETQQVNIDGKPVRLVKVQGEEQEVQKNANRVVREVIAPAFIEKGRNFKATNSKAQSALDRVLNQGAKAPQVETVNSDDIVRQARQVQQQREQKRAQVRQQKLQEVETAVKEGKIRERNTPPGQLKKEEDTRQRNSQVTPQTPPEQSNRPDVQTEKDRNTGPTNRPDNTVNEDQQNNRRNKPDNENGQSNRPADRKTNENQNIPRSNRPVDQNPDEQPPDRRANPDHSNIQPDSDQNSTERNENAIKNGRELPPQAEADKQNSSKETSKDEKSKKAKTNKSKKDKDNKDNNDSDQPPQF